MPQAIPFLIQAAVNLAIAIAVNAVMGLINKALNHPPKPEQGKAPIKQAIPSVQVGFGEVRISGPYALYATVGKFTFDVVLTCRGPIEAVVGFWLNDDYLPIDGTHDPLTVDDVTGVVYGGTDGRYGGGLTACYHRLGVFPEVAYGGVVAYSAGAWTDDDRLDGVASVALVCGAVKPENQQKFYPNGEPLISARKKLSKVYDWRLDGTQPGGVGPQRRDDPSTWTYSRNCAVCMVHDEWFNRGQDWDYRFAPRIAELTVAADVCDEPVDLAAGGTIPRYQVSGWYMLNNPPKDIRDRFLQAMDGMLIESGDGSFILKAGVYEAPTVVLNEDRILECGWKRSRRREDTINKLVVSFNSPDHAFTMVETDPWVDQANIDQVGEKPSDFGLEWVTDNSQARRLAKRSMARLKAQYQGYVLVSLSDDESELEQRFFTVRNRNGPPSMWDAIVEVTGITLDLANRRVRFDIVQADPTMDEWDADTEEGASPDVQAPPTPEEIPVPFITDVDVFQEDTGLGTTAPRLAVTIDDLDRPDLLYIISWKVHADTTWVDGAPTSGDTGGGFTTVDSGFVASVASLDVRIASKSAAGQSDWSATVNLDSTFPQPTPDQATAFTVVPGTDVATADWEFRAPPAYFDHAKILRSLDNNVAHAVQVGADIPGAAGAVLNGTTPLGSGNYFWVQTFNSDNVGGAALACGTNPVAIDYMDARTNLLASPNDFTAWSKVSGGAGSANPAVTANNVTAPDGSLTADTVVFVRGAGGGAFSDLFTSGTVTPATAYDIDVWLKAPAAGPSIALHADSATPASGATLNLTTDWDRYRLTITPSASPQAVEIILYQAIALAPLNATVHAWGAKLALH